MNQLYDKSDDLSSPELKSAAYYAIIPANVRYHQQLSANAKLLYGEISALTTREGYCFASNQYFADLYQVTPRSIIRMVKQLEQFVLFELWKNGTRLPDRSSGGGFI